MALTNAEKQRAWRKRHAARRRTVARIATLLMRQRLFGRDTFKTQLGLELGHDRRKFLPACRAALRRSQDRSGDQSTSVGAGETSSRSQVYPTDATVDPRAREAARERLTAPPGSRASLIMADLLLPRRARGRPSKPSTG